MTLDQIKQEIGNLYLLLVEERENRLKAEKAGAELYKENQELKQPKKKVKKNASG